MNASVHEGSQTTWMAAFLKKDPVVSGDTKCNVNQQYSLSTRNSSGIPSCIQRNITRMPREMILPLYSRVVRLHLEHHVMFWAPHYKKDMDSLERFQWTVTKMMKGLKPLCYKRKLKEGSYQFI